MTDKFDDQNPYAALVESSKKTRFSGERAVEMAKKSAKAREKRKALRQATREILSCAPKMSEAQLESLKKMGIENEAPNVQTLILAQVVNLALKGDLSAVQMLASLAGEDAATTLGEEKLRVEREKIKAMENNGSATARPVIVRRADGAIEVHDG